MFLLSVAALKGPKQEKKLTATDTKEGWKMFFLTNGSPLGYQCTLEERRGGIQSRAHGLPSCSPFTCKGSRKV